MVLSLMLYELKRDLIKIIVLNRVQFCVCLESCCLWRKKFFLYIMMSTKKNDQFRRIGQFLRCMNLVRNKFLKESTVNYMR